MQKKPTLRHVAIIPDGNGRWANKRMQPRVFGHKRGAQVLKKIVEAALDYTDLEVLSIFAFSLENQSRPTDEVGFLMRLLSSSLDDSINLLHSNGIRLRIVGDWSQYPPNLSDKLEKAVKLTENNTRLTLVCALYYSGQWDICTSVRKIVDKIHTGKLTPQALTQQTIADHLSLSDLPNPDLLIRTSGEQRISNFMLWQSAYTELYFSEKLWPDFTPEDFHNALRDYGMRDRRFGRLTSCPSIKELDYA